MSSLNDNEKRYFERLFGMQTGYVLDYSDATYGSLFKGHRIDIHGGKYDSYGTSKAKKMRAFWEQEPDNVVAPVLAEIIDAYEVECDLNEQPPNPKLLEKCKSIVGRLSGKKSTPKPATEKDFLEKEFSIPNLHKLPVESQVATIIQGRLVEARKALGVDASLSVIFLCGSVLEAVLLGYAQTHPEQFNKAVAAPKHANNKVKPLVVSQFEI